DRVLVEAEALDEIDRRTNADLLQHPYRNYIARSVHSLAQRGRAVELAGVVLRPPSFRHTLIREHDRCVIDERRGCEAVLQCGGIDKWLERRARLPLRLSDAVEFALTEIEAAHQAEHGAVISVQADQRGLEFWDGAQFPRFLSVAEIGRASCRERVEIWGVAVEGDKMRR